MSITPEDTAATHTSTFDSTDAVKFQVSKEFPPDKESTWPYPPERDGWVVAHNSLRGEMRVLREAFAAVKKRDEPLKEWEIQAIQASTAGHLEHIHAHHGNEENIFFPVLLERIKLPPKMSDDHEELVKKLGKVKEMIEGLKEGDTIDNLLDEWTEYEALMLPHLKEEEDVGLPLYRAYFTKKEGSEIVQKILAHSPTYELGSLIYFMGVKEFRQVFMRQEGIPGFVWYLQFYAKHKQFVRDIIKPIEAVKEGVPPEAEPGFFSGLFRMNHRAAV